MVRPEKLANVTIQISFDQSSFYVAFIFRLRARKKKNITITDTDNHQFILYKIGNASETNPIIFLEDDSVFCKL